MATTQSTAMDDPTTGNLSLEVCANGTVMKLSSSVALINGYFTPPVVLFTVITNILVCVVLLKPHMRNPTNTMLVSMALSDMFTGLVALPPYFFFYTVGRYVEYLPHDWCYVYECLTEYLPTLFHTASIWLTVALALQRYMCICHSTLANRWSTIPNVIVATGIIYVAATASQFCRFFENDYIPVTIQSAVDPSRLVDACCVQRAAFIRHWLDAYFNIYYWFRIVFIHLIPCSSLVALNAILIVVMRNAQARRRQLLMQNRKTESRRLKDSNCTTFMLVVVVAVFLVVEFPLGIIITLYVIGNTFQVPALTQAFEVPSMYINFLIILSYPLNFFIYCVMSRQFRETFKRLFVPGSARPVASTQSHYQTIATENGLIGKSPVTAETRVRQSESSL